MNNEEGYILIATANIKYFNQALMAAKSIRFFDKTRPITIAYRGLHLNLRDLRFFDNVVRIRRDLRGTENHLYLNEIGVYKRNLYVDSDCLASSDRIHDAWNEISKYNIAFPGQKVTNGKWRVDIEKAKERLGVEYIVRNNGGVFAFDDSEISQAFFKKAQKIFEIKKPNEILIKHITGGGYANEPIWGSVLALQSLLIFPLSYNLNVSTKEVKSWKITSDPSILLTKGNEEKTPVFCHFLGLGKKGFQDNLYNAFLKVLCL